MTKKQRWTYEQLRGGETILPLQTGTNKHDSQKGMTGFGTPRQNITVSKDKGYLNIDPKGNAVVRPQAGINNLASQKGQTPMSAFRNNVPKVAYKPEWTEICARASEGIVPLQAGSNQFASQSGEEVVIGGRRNEVAKVRGRMPKDRRSEKHIPFQSGTNVFASQSGMLDPPGVGAFRTTMVQCEGLNFTEDMARKSSALTPWAAGSNQFASQKGTGGFNKYRDVVAKSSGGKDIPEEQALKSEGLVRLQSGTNKLASQRGMTGFGTPRDTLCHSHWKKDWIEEWAEAEAEFEESGRGNRHARDPITGALIITADNSAATSADKDESSLSKEISSTA